MAPDQTHGPKNYLDDGGDTQVTASGGLVVTEVGGINLEGGRHPGDALTVVRIVKALTGLADTVATAFATVTVPNGNHAAGIEFEVTGALGDQDSAEFSYWTLAISRIAGAATKATLSAKSSNVATAGATANCAVTLTLSGMTGAVGATQTFTVLAAVARSAGASTNHDFVAGIDLFNIKATGVTVA